VSRPRLLDLFHCQGGAAEGYRRAGFDVVGVDCDPAMLRHSPFATVQADALAVLDGQVPTQHLGEQLLALVPVAA
jgi:DNA (cytosine-5)-methyltransferase 1